MADETVQQDEVGASAEAPQGDSAAPSAPDKTAELTQQLNDATARLKAVSAAYKNAQEEMHAFKARLERQQVLKEEILKGEVVSRLFEPLENLRRSIDAMHQAKLDPSLTQGFDLVHRAFLEGFHGLGLAEIGQDGEVFNPDQHEALTMVPVLDPAMDGKIVQVFSKGYRVGTRVIRPARVVIGQYTAPAGEA